MGERHRLLLHDWNGIPIRVWGMLLRFLLSPVRGTGEVNGFSKMKESGVLGGVSIGSIAGVVVGEVTYVGSSTKEKNQEYWLMHVLVILRK